MHITEENIKFIRDILPSFKGGIAEIQCAASEEGIPIVSHETARFLAFLVSVLKPVRILEIGCAVGFSASLFCEYAHKDAVVTTIDRYDFMIERAKINFEKFGLTDKVTLIEGDAADILPDLHEQFDFIFLDAAKAQYINYLNHIIRLLKTDGVFAADDVLLSGGVMSSRYDVPRRQRTTHKRLRNFLYEINSRDDLETSIVPIGGGLALCKKV